MIATALDEENAPASARLAARPDRLLPASARGRWFVAAVLGLALAVRVAEVVVTRHSYSPVNDSRDFDSIAMSLIHGHGFGPALVPPATGPTAYRGPLYPIVLAAWYLVVGHSWTWGRIEQAVFGTAVVALIGLVAAQLFGRRAAAVALVLAAVYPTLILYGSSLQLETLLMTLSLAAVACALQYRRHPAGLGWPIASGLLVGLTLLTRELGIVLIPAVLAMVWPQPADRPAAEGRARATRLAPAALLLSIVVVLVPWTVRNELSLHTLAPTSTSTGFTLAGTYNPTAAADHKYPTLWRPPYEDPGDTALLLGKPHPGEAWVNHVLEKATIDYIKAHPTYPLRAAYWNAAGLFDLEGTRISLYMAQFIPYPPTLVRWAVYSSYLVELLAIIAIFLPLTRRAPKVLWSIPVLAIVVIIFVSGNIRYRASIEPYTVLLATVTLATILERTPWLRRAGPVPATSG